MVWEGQKSCLEKEKIHFFLFPQCFLPIPRRISAFDLHLFCHLRMLSFWKSQKMLFGKVLTQVFLKPHGFQQKCTGISLCKYRQIWFGLLPIPERG